MCSQVPGILDEAGHLPGAARDPLQTRVGRVGQNQGRGSAGLGHGGVRQQLPAGECPDTSGHQQGGGRQQGRPPGQHQAHLEDAAGEV